MRQKWGWLVAGLVIAGGGFLWFYFRQANKVVEMPPVTNFQEEEQRMMKLTSAGFEPESEIPAKYTCDGENLSPPLGVTGVPAQTQYLALIVDDSDAPAGDWVHWLVWQIDPQIKEFVEGKSPEGAVQGLNDFGNNEYSGPCPPSGRHRYQFKLYALDTSLELIDQVNKAKLLEVMAGHILEQTMLVGFYQKKTADF